MRSLGKVTDKKIDSFCEIAASLLTELKNAVEHELIPYGVGMQMQETIRKTLEDVLIKSKQEGDFTMTTNIVETMPWIDYREVFAKLEARGKAEGEAKGKAEGKAEGEAKAKMEIARKAFEGLNNGKSMAEISDTLKEFGIPDDIIESARLQAATGHPR